MSVMGKKIPNLNLTVCSKFKPRVLEGQLCYQIDVNEFVNQMDSKKLMSHGLIFLMDYNEDRLGLNMNTDLDTAADEVDLKENDDDHDKRTEAKIYIQTQGMHNFDILKNSLLLQYH